MIYIPRCDCFEEVKIYNSVYDIPVKNKYYVTNLQNRNSKKEKWIAKAINNERIYSLSNVLLDYVFYLLL